MSKAKKTQPLPSGSADCISKYFKKGSSQAGPGSVNHGHQAAPARKPSCERSPVLANLLLSQPDAEDQMEEVVWAPMPTRLSAPPVPAFAAAPDAKVASQGANADKSHCDAPQPSALREPLTSIDNRDHTSSQGALAAAGHAKPRVSSVLYGDVRKRSLIAAMAGADPLGAVQPTQALPEPAATRAEPPRTDEAAGVAASEANPAGVEPRSCPPTVGAEGAVGVDKQLSRQSSVSGLVLPEGGQQVSDDVVLDQVLQWACREPVVTPATVARSRSTGSKRRLSVGSSTVKRTSHLGQKRRMFLDLLEQVDWAARQPDSTEDPSAPRSTSATAAQGPTGTGPIRQLTDSALQQPRSASNTPRPPTSAATTPRLPDSCAASNTDITLACPSITPSPEPTNPVTNTNTAAGSVAASAAGPGAAAANGCVPATAGGTSGVVAPAERPQGVGVGVTGPSSAYHCSVQEYDDFLESLDMDVDVMIQSTLGRVQGTQQAGAAGPAAAATGAAGTPLQGQQASVATGPHHHHQQPATLVYQPHATQPGQGPASGPQAARVHAHTPGLPYAVRADAAHVPASQQVPAAAGHGSGQVGVGQAGDGPQRHRGFLSVSGAPVGAAAASGQGRVWDRQPQSQQQQQQQQPARQGYSSQGHGPASQTAPYQPAVNQAASTHQATATHLARGPHQASSAPPNIPNIILEPPPLHTHTTRTTTRSTTGPATAPYPQLSQQHHTHNTGGPAPTVGMVQVSSSQQQPYGPAVGVHGAGSQQYTAGLQPQQQQPLQQQLPQQLQQGVGLEAGPSLNGTILPKGPPQLAGDRRNVLYRVLEVEDSGFDRVLRVVSEYNRHEGRPVVVHLRDIWADLPAQPGDPVNLLCEVTEGADGQLHATCCSAHGMVVLHPDVLISGTSVTNAIECTRKAWLNELLVGSSNTASLLGTLMHEVLQKTLTAAMNGPVTHQHTENLVCETLMESTLRLHEVGLAVDDAKRELMAKSAVIRAWATTYTQRDPQQATELRMGPGHKGPPLQAAITEVSDIEESVWAPKYGLKGQIDASLRVRLTKAPDITNAWRGARHGSGAHSGPGGAHAATQLPLRAGGAGRHSAPAVGAVAATQGYGAGPAPATACGVNSSGVGHGGEAGDVKEIVVPFEFKSGKHHHSHRAQVSLYLLLMEDRHSEPCDLGLLWNLQDGPMGMHAVQRVQAELAALVMHRNRLAAYLARPVRAPPPMLGSEQTCSRCFARTQCSIYHKAIEGGNSVSSGMGSEAWHSLTSHLTEEHCRFFSHWSLLVELEEGDVRVRRPAMWSVAGGDRIKSGKCVAHLTLKAYEGTVTTDSTEQASLTQHCYLFTRHTPTHTAPTTDHNTHPPPLPPPAQQQQQHTNQSAIQALHHNQQQHAQQGHNQLADAQTGIHSAEATTCEGNVCDAGVCEGEEGEEDSVVVCEGADGEGVSVQGGGGGGGGGVDPGEMMVLSVEGEHVNVARVVVMDISQDCVRVLSKKRIRLAHQLLNAAAAPTLPLGLGQNNSGDQHNVNTSNARVTISVPPVRWQWRLDRDEPAQGHNVMRSNLVELLSGTNRQCQRLRQLVIDLAPPRRQRVAHIPHAQQGPHAASQLSVTQALTSNARLNTEQQEAVRAVLEMQDYALILGMPGTGKTSTIVEAIRALLALNRTILITAYTHSAVDNICIKLAQEDLPFVRVPAASDAVHPAVRPYVPGGAKYPLGRTVLGFSEIVSSVRVVAVTCLGLKHPLLARKVFDVCVLDEASQVSLPASLGPLTRSRAWVLVGDHYQLPPLVTNSEAAERGYGESLFRRLCEAHPQAVVTLRRQYRMAAPIMSLSNTLIYSGALQCGSESVATQQLTLPCWETLQSVIGPEHTWVLQTLNPTRHVVFLDTDSASECLESRTRDAILNTGEAHLVHTLVSALVKGGVTSAQLGVVSAYRAQVSLLQRLVNAPNASENMAGAVPPADAAATAAAAGSGGATRVSSIGGQAGGVLGPGPGSSNGGSGCGGEALGGVVSAAVEVLTIDKYQGRDKDVILMSCVRSNDVCAAGNLLCDWQRINVALTRAKKKMILIGGVRTLRSVPLLAAMLDTLQRDGCVVPLPAHAATSSQSLLKALQG